MFVVQIEPPSPSLQGDQLYRTVQPCRALAQQPQTHVLSGPWLSQAVQAAAAQADVLILCQAVEVDLLPLWTARRAAKKTCIFEINDYFAALQPGNAVKSFYDNPSMRALAYHFGHTADGLQLSSEGLLQCFAALNPQHRLVRNHLWEAPRPPRHRQGSEPLRLGWGGSLGHRDDIAWALPCLAGVLRAHPEVHFAAMAPSALHPLFEGLAPGRCTLYGLGDSAAYAQFVASLDIGIAPLRDTAFNRGRSDVKYLEYTQGGAAAVLQNLTPYQHSVVHGQNGLLFDSLGDLRACLDSLIEHPQRRAALVAQAQAQAASTRLQAAQAPAQLAFLRHAGPPTTGPRDDPSGARRFAQLTADIPRTFSAPRYVAVGLRPAEQVLYEGMLGLNEPRQAAAAALQLDPGYALAHLQLGALHPDPRQAALALQRALALNPCSLAAYNGLAQRCLAQGDLSGCREHFLAALRVAPGFAPAHDCLGQLALQAGDAPAARQHFEAALSANRYFRLPARRLATLALERQQPAHAERLLRGSLALDDDAWVEHHLMGQALLQRRAFAAAQAHLERALRLAPEAREVRLRLAQALVAQGRGRAARQLLGAQGDRARTS